MDGPLGGNLLEFLKPLSTVSRAPLKFRSFKTEHVIDTPARFSKILILFYVRQLLVQVIPPPPPHSPPGVSRG
jgi:hypothetical protein